MKSGRYTDPIALAVVPILARMIMRLLSLTMKFDYLNDEMVRKWGSEGRQAIYSFWHGRLFMLPFGYFGPKLTGFVSRHRDGEYLARTLRGFGIECERGSNTRGWFGGLKGVLRAAKRGSDLAYAPDGPTGPRYEVKGGVIQIARATGLPILPITFSASKKKTLSSWDHFIVPYPFSRGVFVYGEPITVPRDAGDDEMEAKRVELQEAMNDTMDRADRFFEGG